MATVSTYLGPKGYTMLKAGLGVAECRTVRDELMARPHIPKAPVQPPAFAVYRESLQKMYVPRFYGWHTFGAPEAILLSSGVDISVPFVGDLRPDQQHIVATYQAATSLVTGGGGLLEIPCGRGKTVDACKIISVMRKKTLVIVHKGFLLNQWIERIGQFLPTARVGRIQGPVVDIENKDIVLGMLQSLSMKEYPADLFSSFGLTIVDECHHISSEVFCRSLAKIVTFYTLGLSATMERKDGLTSVFKMFLGPILYTEKRAATDTVLVKGLQYVTDNAEFNEQVTDYRGNPAFSTMISKLCTYSHRSEFILEVLQRELRGRPAQQVMILAHNKNLLTYLHDAIKHRYGPTGAMTVGYYVGGMKEAALKQTELCQVIIATYAMAAEALDIKTLTTLIMATPKTDITQAVGRILRVKHERPLVIDIIDSHDMFKKQWARRKKFYKTQNYTVVYMTSPQYLAQKVAEVAQEDEEEEEEDDDTMDVDDDQKEKVVTKKTVVGKQKCLINLENMMC
jgi:superfamily II DNA or RNA helicase